MTPAQAFSPRDGVSSFNAKEIEEHIYLRARSPLPCRKVLPLREAPDEFVYSKELENEGAEMQEAAWRLTCRAKTAKTAKKNLVVVVERRE